MIGATPVDGGHYFSDVIAGTATAVVCWIVAGRIVHGLREEIARIENSPSIEPDMIPSSAGAVFVPVAESKPRIIA